MRVSKYRAVISNTATSQFFNSWGTYYTGTAIAVALGDAAGPTTAYTALDTAGDGSFSGTVDGAGTHVWVQACRGYHLPPLVDACSEFSVPIG